MARSLFDELRARQGEPPPPPKLKPNIHARMARAIWRNAAVVIAGWFLVSLVCGYALWRESKIPSSASLPMPVPELAIDSAATSFGSLANLQTITLSNAHPEMLEDQRNDLIVTMRQRDDIYQMVFAPGSGEYYEANGLLYHPLDEVKGRVCLLYTSDAADE